MRDSSPTGIDLSGHALEDLARVAAEVNQRSRKTLAWSRPLDLFTTALQSP
ncbi:MAG: hypothetical protein ACJ780_13210 [Solirubrobacteraceae bacterium]